MLPIEVLGGAQISNQSCCQCIQSCCWGLSRQQEGRFAGDNSDNGGPGDNKDDRLKEVAAVQQTVMEGAHSNTSTRARAVMPALD